MRLREAVGAVVVAVAAATAAVAPTSAAAVMVAVAISAACAAVERILVAGVAAECVSAVADGTSPAGRRFQGRPGEPVSEAIVRLPFAIPQPIPQAIWPAGTRASARAPFTTR
jgi:hypothetical protein